MLLGVQFGLQRLHLFLQRLELSSRFAQAGLELGQLAKTRLVFIPESLIALAQELGGVNALQKLGMLC